jgi:hypothetical protein
MLCMRSRTSDMQLWVLEDLDTKVWSQRQTISIMQQPLIPKEEPYYFSRAFLSSDVVLLMGAHTMVLNNFKTRTCIVRDLSECEGWQQTNFPILSDLKLVSGRYVIFFIRNHIKLAS